MRVALHIGAHCTDENHLIRSLMKNGPLLDERGIFIPKSPAYRAAMRDVLIRLRGKPATLEAQDYLLSEIMGDAEAERLVLSFDSFLCAPAKVLSEGRLYPMAGERTEWHRNLFPEDPCDFFLAIRDPVTFIPALFAKVSKNMSFPAFMNGIDPLSLNWAEVIEDIREANPESDITVWCNEDTPLIWPEVLRELGDLDQLTEIEGGFDVIQTIMTKEGFARMQSYLKSRPPHNAVQRRRVMAAFLDKFAIAEEIDEEVDIPGWTPALMDALTQSYEEDVYEISRIPGVNLITT